MDSIVKGLVIAMSLLVFLECHLEIFKTIFLVRMVDLQVLEVMLFLISFITLLCFSDTKVLKKILQKDLILWSE